MQEQKEQNNGKAEERNKRLAVALTVAGTLLVLFLVIILIIQFVQIGVRNARIERYNEQIKEYNRIISEDQKDLEYYMTEEGLYYLALENGYTKGGK